jgi:hypothetical protein
LESDGENNKLKGGIKMLDFINDLIMEVFGEFDEIIRETPTLCTLKKFNFSMSNVPDYNNLLYQQLYLLRFAHAYIMEYYRIYKKILNTRFLDLPLKILSVGAGSFLDLYGLYFLLQDMGIDPTYNIQV